jgi:hypothetical protein
MNRNQKIVLAFANTAAFLVTILVNYLASTLPLNQKTTGEISALYDNLFVPAGFTFSIWGIIYLLLAGYVVYQLVDAFRIQENNPGKGFTEKISLWFIASSIANCLWLFAWHYEALWIALFIMLSLLSTLIIIYLRLKQPTDTTSAIEPYIVHLPFTVYVGWISVATIANFSAALVSINWNGFGLPPQFWAVFVILIAGALGIFSILRKGEIAYAAVIAWGLLGIFFKRFSDSSDPPTPDMVIEIATLLCVLALLGLIIWYLWMRNAKRPAEV